MVNPSILDLLNSICSTDPENVVDIIAGASKFYQIDHMWSLAKAQGNDESMIESMRHEADRLLHALNARMLDNRRVNFEGDGVGYVGVTFERRLVLIIEMADRLPNSPLRSLIEPLFARLQDEWDKEFVNLDDAVQLLHTLNSELSIDYDALGA